MTRAYLEVLLDVLRLLFRLEDPRRGRLLHFLFEDLFRLVYLGPLLQELFLLLAQALLLFELGLQVAVLLGDDVRGLLLSLLDPLQHLLFLFLEQGDPVLQGQHFDLDLFCRVLGFEHRARAVARLRLRAVSVAPLLGSAGAVSFHFCTKSKVRSKCVKQKIQFQTKITDPN